MGNIHHLDKVLVSQIAAGEVIERPANVVKELVENAIDANSSHIQIEVEEGGLTLIRIMDDGCGMDREDANMCFEEHATSKIKTNFDLFNITTLGFRGEAVPSIASISHLELETSTGNEGTKVVYEYGNKISEETVGCQKGTTFTITKLFQNVPARLKYMKSVNYEFSRILSFVERFALSHPDIAFSLYHQQRLVFQTSGNNQLVEVFGQIYGLQVARNMMAIENENDDFAISGYISRIDTSRASKNNIITLINGRVVKAATVVDAVNNAYRDYLFPDRFPIALVNVSIDPFLVDVNVHPSKMEVRFSKEDELYQLIFDTVLNKLKEINQTYEAHNRETERNLSPIQKSEQIALEIEDVVEAPKQEELTLVEQSLPPQFQFDEPVKGQEAVVSNYQEIIQEPMGEVYHQTIEPIEEKKPILKKIYAKCQIHGTYIVGENQDGFYLIDQHAAKERINYEYFKAKFTNKDPLETDLLVPLIFEFPSNEALLLRERRELLKSAGITLEDFGNNSFVVKKLPVWMKEINERVYIETMCDSIIHQNKLDELEIRKDAIATLACKASVKGNTYLSPTEMQGLLDDLMRIENPYVCPHGRPTMIFYSGYELEKLFKRVV